MRTQAIVVLAVLPLLACGSGSRTPPDLDIDPQLTLSQLSSAQRHAFCEWELSAPPVVCDSFSTVPPADQDPDVTENTCLQTFELLPNCTVGAYEACLDEYYWNICDATASSATACQALLDCGNFGATALRASGSPPLAPEVKITDCLGGMFTPLLPIIWEVRRWKDRWVTNNVPQILQTMAYCSYYEGNFIPNTWRQGNMCLLSPVIGRCNAW